MFPVDTFQAQYLEEREAAEIAKRLAKLQEQQQRAQMAAVSAKLAADRDSSSSSSSQQQPRSLSTAFLQTQQRPPLSRASSQTVLGSIFQNFTARSSSQPPLNTHLVSSGTSTPARTPLLTPTKNMTQSEMEAAMAAEKKRDADICAMPAWYH